MDISYSDFVKIMSTFNDYKKCSFKKIEEQKKNSDLYVFNI